MAILENIQNSKVVRAYRQGYLAWLGANKTAFDFAQDSVSRVLNSRDELVDELVQKGEEVEGYAQDNFAKVRDYVEPRFNEVNDKITEARGKVFNRENADGRVEELTAEVAKLTKTVNALSRKVNAAAKKPVAKKPVAKKAATKPAAKKAAPKKAAAPKAAPKAAPAAEAKVADKAAA